jgi:hypothetical protein
MNSEIDLLPRNGEQRIIDSDLYEASPSAGYQTVYQVMGVAL